jgi:hypothetical protein
MSSRILLLSVTSAAFLCGAMPAAATPTLLGVFKGWTAASTGAGDQRVCYAIAHPTSSLPAKAKRDPIGFLISNWPARKAAAEPEVVPGYVYKEGSTVTAQVGADKFTFFVKNEGDSGSAWIKDPADEVRLIDAIKRGSSMTITGVSRRGTLTTDNYSLAGVSDALDKIQGACSS